MLFRVFLRDFRGRVGLLFLLLCACSLAGVAVIPAVLAAPRTLTVGGGGYSTIGAAMSAAASGDTIRVHAGTYPEQVEVNKSVTIEAFGDGQVSINSACTRENGVHITASNVTIRGLAIKNTRGAGVFIDGSTTSATPAFVTIDGNTIQDFDCTYRQDITTSGAQHNAGVAAWYSGSNITVKNNVIKHRVEITPTQVKGSADGIWFKSNDGNPSGGGHYIAGNTIVGGWDGIGGEEEGSVHGTFDKNTVIERNVVRDCWDDGIQAEGGAANVHVQDNEITGCGTGIAFAAPVTGPLHVERNNIHDLVTGRLGNNFCYKVGNSSSATVYLNDNICRSLTGTNGIQQTNPGMFPIIARRNVWNVSRYVYEITETPGGMSFDFSCMFTSDPSRFIKWQGGTLYTSLVAFRAGTPHEDNGQQTTNCAFLGSTPTPAPTAPPTPAPTMPATPAPTTPPSPTPNPVPSSDNDRDGMPDVVDPDDDNDGVHDSAEIVCGSSPWLATRRPERVDGPFAGVSDDGDSLVDEALPAASAAADCDGDGFFGTAERAIFSSTTYRKDQDPCGTDGWPADLASAGTLDAGKITLLDLTSFLVPVRHIGKNVGAYSGDARWDLSPGKDGLKEDINISDVTELTILAPPMLDGSRALNGPGCPWPP